MTGATATAALALALRHRTLRDKVVAACGITHDELTGSSRVAHFARARFAYSWLAREVLGESVRSIAAHLGSRDHTTTINALERARDLRRNDPSFRRLTDRLLAEMGGRHRDR